MQLHLLFQTECKWLESSADMVDEEIVLVDALALRLQIAHGDFSPKKSQELQSAVHALIAQHRAAAVHLSAPILRSWRKLVHITEINAKFRFVQV